MNLKHLSDDKLLLHVDRCIKKERKITVILLSYFAEIENRQLYLQSSKTSMFQWLVEMNNYSNGAAARRLAAARLMYRFPWIAKKIELGELQLTALHILSSHNDAVDFETLLLDSCGKTKLGLEEILARRSNKVAPRREIVRMFVGKVSKENKSIASVNEVGSPVVQTQTCSPIDNTLFSSPENKLVVGSPANQAELGKEPLMRMTLTLDKQTFENLKHAQRLTDSKDMATVVKLALQAFIETKDRTKKLMAPVKLRKPVKEKSILASEPSRNIPIANQRLAFKRDGWQCTHTHNGIRCQERVHLELDHIIPFALGGTSDLENIRVVCRAHNRWYAKESFGREFIENKIKEKRAKKFGSPLKLNRIEQSVSPSVNLNRVEQNLNPPANQT